MSIKIFYVAHHAWDSCENRRRDSVTTFYNIETPMKKYIWYLLFTQYNNSAEWYFNPLTAGATYIRVLIFY